LYQVAADLANEWRIFQVLTRLQAPQHQQAADRPGHNPSICSGYRVIDPGFARFVPGIDPRSTNIYQVKIKFFSSTR